MKNTKKLLTLLLVTVLILESFTVAALAAGSGKSDLIVTTESISQDALNTILDDMEENTQQTPSDTENNETTDPEGSESTPPEDTPQEPTIVESGKCGDNLTWVLDSDGVLTISGKGEMKDFSKDSRPPWYGKSADYVVIESGVTNVGAYAFYECHIRGFEIPGTVKTIGTYAFAYNSMEELVLPKGVTKIGDYAFAYCESFHFLALPSTLKTIGKYAFICCAFDAIDIPDSVTSLGDAAFWSCASLEAIYISNNLTKLKENLFRYCSNLEVVILPASIVEIEDFVFEGCNSLTSILYLGTEKQLNKIDISTTGNSRLANVTWYLVTLITKQPQDVKTIAGKTAKFSIAVSRDNCKFQWYYVAPGTETSVACSGSSAKKATLSVTAKAELDGYQYYCVITDEFGTEGESQKATLSIVPAPKITKQPESVMVKIGEKASVTVEAEGEGLKYQWYYAKKGSSKFKKASITGDTYSVTMDSSRDGRKLYCVITDAYGQTLKSETVAIHRETTPLLITQQPESVTVKYGEKAAVSVAASGDGLKYQWYYAKAGSTKFKKASITKATYSVSMEGSRDGRQLYCVITDEYGKTAKTDIVTIHMETVPLTITEQPASVTVRYGEKASVKVGAEGDGLKYQWYYAKAGSNKFKKASITKDTYSVAMDGSRDGRQLYCVVKDVYGKSIKTEVVTINMEKVPLAITEQPASVTVKYGEKATVKVGAEGDGLTYQWYYAKAGAKKFKKASITKDTYSVAMDGSRDGRQLYCVITDVYGKTVKTEIVTVSMEKTALAIVTQPESVTVAKGTAATVKVEAEGDGLKYQWYYAKAGSKSFKAASITDDTYSVEMTNSRNGRQLYCVITDAYGNTVKTDVVTINME